jgi:hypothetical protein
MKPAPLANGLPVARIAERVGYGTSSAYVAALIARSASRPADTSYGSPACVKFGRLRFPAPLPRTESGRRRGRTARDIHKVRLT